MVQSKFLPHWEHEIRRLSRDQTRKEAKALKLSDANSARKWKESVDKPRKESGNQLSRVQRIGEGRI